MGGGGVPRNPSRWSVWCRGPAEGGASSRTRPLSLNLHRDLRYPLSVPVGPRAERETVSPAQTLAGPTGLLTRCTNSYVEGKIAGSSEARRNPGRPREGSGGGMEEEKEQRLGECGRIPGRRWL